MDSSSVRQRRARALAPLVALVTLVLAAGLGGAVSATDEHSFPVLVRTAPPEADFWLDGLPAGTGQLSMTLERDGRTHELRIQASGYTSQTFLFQDVPPPERVTLQPVPGHP